MVKRQRPFAKHAVRRGALKRVGGLATAVAITCASAAADELPPRFFLQSTADYSSLGAFYSEIMATYAPFGNLRDTGWRVQGDASVRRYGITEAGQKRIGLDTTLDALAGYEFVPNDDWSWLFAAGPTVVNSHLNSAPGLVASNQTKYGVKVLTSLYGKPTNDTFVFAQANYNTASNFYYLQSKTGFAIAPDIFVGPEASFSGTQTATFSGNSTSRQFRLGGHVTGFKLARFSSGFSLGFVRDNALGNGFYAGANLQTEF